MLVCKVFHHFFLILWLGSLFLMPYLIWSRFEGAKKVYQRLQFPCMLAAIFFGLILLINNPAKLKIGWFHMKLTAAFALIALDLWIGRRKAVSRAFVIAFQIVVALLIIAVLTAIQLAKIYS